MQALFENPLAEPRLLGVPNGAGVGIMLSIFASIDARRQLSLFAIVGALLVTTYVAAHFAEIRLKQPSVAGRNCAGYCMECDHDLGVLFQQQSVFTAVNVRDDGRFNAIDWRYGW